MVIRLGAGAALLMALIGCDGDGPVALLRQAGNGRLNVCTEPSVLLSRVRAAGAVESSENDIAKAVALAPLEGFTALQSEAEACVRLVADGARYLVVPNYPSQGSSASTKIPFVLTADGISVALSAEGSLAPPDREGDVNLLQHRFDIWLRERELELQAPVGRARAPVGPLLQVSEPEPIRHFKVLGSLTGSDFETAVARLRFAGENVLLYVDTTSPPGFSDQEISEFGNLFDNPLYDITVQAFGDVSDIDGNSRIIVLLSPLVNALTAANDCPTLGFVTGYFFGFDLASTSENSNKAEIFYGLVPDTEGKFSCAHSTAQVKQAVTGTFVHELQHMISFNQHVLVRNGPSEDLWLNEGLSHISEELASRYYELKFPPPQGRTNPEQLFPDSSQSFIGGNLLNAYNYLVDTEDHSVTTFDRFGTLEERGAAWLFLRYLGDLKGDAIFGRLVQTRETGIQNIETQAGEEFEPIFGDFSVALWTDSLPGIPRTAIPERYRFKSRNLRQIYARLNQTGSTSRLYPVSLESLTLGTAINESMPHGTMDLFQLPVQLPGAGAGAIEFTLAPPATIPAFPASLTVQLSVFRLP